MNINAISFNGIYKIQQPKSQYIQHFGNNPDTFELTSKTVSRNSHDDILNKLNNAQLMQSIFSNPQNKLGEGFTHSVYSIPDNDEYVLRVSNYFDPDIIDFSNPIVKDTEDKDLEINIGQEIAELKYKRKDYPGTFERISVLRKQKGKSIGVPPFETMCYPDSEHLRPGKNCYESQENREKYASSIKAVAKLPLSAYEQLLDNVTEAYNHGYYFDYLNSNNILYDEASQSLNLIDMEKGRRYLNYGNLLYALTNISYYGTYTDNYKYPISDEEFNEITGATITVIDKYLQAMKNKNLKINKNDFAYQTNQLFLSIPMKFYCKSFDTNAVWDKLEDMGILIKN